MCLENSRLVADLQPKSHRAQATIVLVLWHASGQVLQPHSILPALAVTRACTIPDILVK